MSARSWPLGVVLSFTQDRLACNFADVQEFAEWMLGEPVFTLGVAASVEPIRAHVLAQRPDLAVVMPPEVQGERGVLDWVDRMALTLGTEVALEPFPPGTVTAGGACGEFVRLATREVGTLRTRVARKPEHLGRHMAQGTGGEIWAAWPGDHEPTAADLTDGGA